MNKTDFIIRQIAKSSKKKYENYVVTRIWHLLNNLDIKLVTQQHVTRPEGRALTDMYFPQIQLHIEVDESQHYNADGSQVMQDIVREADIINATGHTIKRISIFTKSIEGGIEKCVENTIENIHQQIDKVVDFIKKEVKQKAEAGKLRLWDIKSEYDPAMYIKKGAMSADDDVAFNTVADACNCFGHNYKGYQRATANHAVEKDRILWFPKLYENQDWNNTISPDEDEITMQKKVGHKEWAEEQKRQKKPADSLEWLVFAHVRGPLGDVMYRFKGVYKSDPIKSEVLGKVIFNRVDRTVKTYNPLK